MIHDGVVLPAALVFSEASDGAVRAYAAIALGRLFPPRVGDLAATMGVTERTARRYLTELVARGFLTLDAKRGGNGGTEYLWDLPSGHRTILSDGDKDAGSIGQFCPMAEADAAHRTKLSDGEPPQHGDRAEISEEGRDTQQESDRNPSGPDDQSLTIRKTLSQELLESCEKDRVGRQADRASLPQVELFEAGEVPARAPTPEEVLEATARRTIDRLNMTCGRKYQYADTSMAPVRQRLREGASEADLALVVEFKNEEWGDDDRMAQFLRPSTLFKPEQFAAYLGAAERWAAGGRKPATKRARTEAERRDDMRQIDEARKLENPGKRELSPRESLTEMRIAFFDKHGRAMNRDEEDEAKRLCGMLGSSVT